jgi:hypothetical protein
MSPGLLLYLKENIMTMPLRLAQAILNEPKYVEARRVVEEYEAKLEAKVEVAKNSGLSGLPVEDNEPVIVDEIPIEDQNPNLQERVD